MATDADLCHRFGNPTATANDLVHFIDIVEPKVVFCDTGDVMTKVTTAIDKAQWSKTRKPDLVGLGERGTAKLAVGALQPSY